MKLAATSAITFAFLLFFIITVALAQGWPFVARLFPWTIGIAGIILGVIQLYRDLTGWWPENEGGASGLQVDEVVENRLPLSVEVRRAGVLFGMLAGIALAVWSLGFSVAMPAFVLAYMRFEGRESWPIVLLMTGITILFVTVFFEQFLEIPWPEGVIWHWLGID